jgi:hypothetical protein
MLVCEAVNQQRLLYICFSRGCCPATSLHATLLNSSEYVLKIHSYSWGQKVLLSLYNPNVRHRAHKCLSFDPALRLFKSRQHICNHINFILPSILGLPNDFLTFYVYINIFCTYFFFSLCVQICSFISCSRILTTITTLSD